MFDLRVGVQRVLSKANYKIHTDAIAEHLIPKTFTTLEILQVYASKVDVLNQALFGCTAKEWQHKNLEKKGNLRDFATLEQLVVLCNLESLNVQWILDKLPQKERLVKLNATAIYQMKSLLNSKSFEKLVEKSLE